MAHTYLKAVCLGVISGMRSMGGPALASHYLRRHASEALAQSPVGWLGTARAAQITKMLVAGEIVGDKLPMTPNRTDPGPLVGRIMSGSLSGAALCAADCENIAAGGVIGAVSAIAGAYAFYHLRRRLGQSSGVPDPVMGALEDLLAYGVGINVVRR